VFLQCVDTVGWVIWPIKNPSPIWPITCKLLYPSLLLLFIMCLVGR